MATAASAYYHVNQITGAIVNSAMKVHSFLGPDSLKAPIKRALHTSFGPVAYVKTEVALPVIYEGYKLEAGYRVDLIVEDRVVFEMKSAEAIHPIHEAQLLSYMRLSGIGVGLLINFNVLRLRDGVKRMVDGQEWRH